ncbi:MAG: peptidoglycan editing factor PgeF [Chloroflexi bacterium]|nr:peptidoglycan editing factor PgeF [Chloroflexota bacterium]
MQLQQCGSLQYYTFDSLSQFQGLQHGAFTRHGGDSQGVWHSLNLSKVAGDAPEAVHANLAAVAAVFNAAPADLTSVWLVHGNHILEAGAGAKGAPLGQADGVITHIPGVPLLMRSADCVPVLVYDPEHRAVGLAHAGWRGTLSGATYNLVQRMIQVYGSRPEALIAGIGPSIGPCCYQVGPEVVAAVRQNFTAADTLLPLQRDGSYHFDLWQANARWLKQAHVGSVEHSGQCTACQVHDWFSHRQEYGKTGRFGLVAMLI